MKFGIIPKISAASLPLLFGYAIFGAIIAAGYGIVHDQLTYSISPEYFTRMKFLQFHYANFGFPRRVFVAEVGVLATWWVGFVGGWLMARIVVPAVERNMRLTYMFRAIAIMFTFAFAGSVTGYILGFCRIRNPNMENWFDCQMEFGINDLKAFVRVAYIHNASYIGGFFGLVVALLYLWRATRKPGLGAGFNA